MVHKLNFQGSGKEHWPFQIRCSSCLDAYIKQNSWYNHLFHLLGLGCKPSSLACSNHERSWSGTAPGTQGSLSLESDLAVHMACVIGNVIAFLDHCLPIIVGESKDLSENWRYGQVQYNLGWDLHWSLSPTIICAIYSLIMNTSITYVVQSSVERSPNLSKGWYKHADRSICLISCPHDDKIIDLI